MSKKPNAEFAKIQASLLKAYADFSRANGRHPSRADMLDQGHSRDQIRAHFGSLEKLKVAAGKAHPEIFAGIFDQDTLTEKRMEATRKEIHRFKRLVVTTAVTGCSVDEEFYNSLQTYCDLNDARLVVLISSDPAAIKNNFYLDPTLLDELVVYDDVAVNNNLFLSTIKLSAKQIDPVTSLGRIGQRNGSMIYASPKQRLKMAATSNHALPHAMWTTGAITTPGYDTDRYMSKRVSYLATHDHVMGALIVEIENKDVFHCRPIQADAEGCFADLGVLYSPNGVQAYRPQALVMGDWHSGSTCPKVVEATFEDANNIFERTQPLELVLHDFFDGMSINHHEEKDVLLRARRAELGKLNLAEEVKNCTVELNFLAAKAPCRIVASNHDDFLRRYLTEGRYLKEPANLRFAADLVGAAIDGANPLQVACEKSGLKHLDRIKWLKLDDDYKVAGVELGCHGHKGSNGSKGSTRAMENAYGNSVSGHTHTPEILRGAMVVGTSTVLHLDYNQGPSSWLNAHALVYPNGQKQLINIIEGKWSLPIAPRLAAALKAAAKKRR